MDAAHSHLREGEVGSVCEVERAGLALVGSWPLVNCLCLLLNGEFFVGDV